MTNKEIINEIKHILEELNYEDAVSYLTQNDKTWLEESIKALEQQPCEDAISREQAINQCGFGMTSLLIADNLRKLPPVTPMPKTGHWIPCSERLPNDGQSVLFCDIDNDIMVGYHVKGRPATHFTQVITYEDMKNAKGWMPLPEPYEPQESEEAE